MERYTIRFSPKAFDDLEKINKYICDKLLEPNIAYKTSKLITDEINKLEEFPFRNPNVFSSKNKYKNLKKMIVKKYIIFYDVTEDAKIINILRILYASSEWIKKI